MNSMFHAHKKKDGVEMKIQEITLQAEVTTVASHQSPVQAGVFLSIQTKVKYWHRMLPERSAKFPLSFKISISL